MDTSNMSEEEMKRQTAGKGCFSVLSIFSTAAFICGLYANAYCDFAEREIIFAPEYDLETACTDLDFEDTALEDICNSLLGEHGIGFYGFWGTVPVDTQVCFSYTQPIPGVGYITPEFDTKFNAARAFAVTANVLGAFAWFTIAMSSCCKLDQSRLNGMTCYFLLACLFQGLSLLIFKSDICEPGFYAAYFPNQDMGDIIAEVDCSLGRGAKLAICATVFYFVCNTITPLCIVPDPVRYSGYSQAPAEAAPPAAAPAAPAAASEPPASPAAAASETEEA
jgi:hypothetical protein